LRGKRTTVEYAEEGGRLKYSIRVSNQPYVYNIDDNGGVRSYDFSDPTMVRELHLY
jgi:hypothetical protein